MLLFHVSQIVREQPIVNTENTASTRHEQANEATYGRLGSNPWAEHGCSSFIPEIPDSEGVYSFSLVQAGRASVVGLCARAIGHQPTRLTMDIED